MCEFIYAFVHARTHTLPLPPTPTYTYQPPQVWKQQAVEAGEVGAHEVVGALPFPSLAAAERYVGGSFRCRVCI